MRKEGGERGRGQRGREEIGGGRERRREGNRPAP